MLARDILTRARLYLNARQAGVTFWTDGDLLLLLDDAEARYRTVVSRENIDFLRQFERDISYPASTRSVDLMANAPLGTRGVQIIRRVLDITGGEQSPVEIEEVSWGELERWELYAATQEGVLETTPRVFAWSGRDFALRPTLGSAATIRLRYVGRKREVRALEDEPETLMEQGLDDFVDLYALAVAVAAKETKGGESVPQLRARLAEREGELQSRLHQRTFETPEQVTYEDW